MTTRLDLYNGALLLAGERFIATLSEAREPRRLLDQVHQTTGIKAALEKGQWHFAMRAQRLDYDPSQSRDWGYTYAFAKGTDWVQTCAMCSDEYFTTPILRYADEAEYWWCDLQQIFVKFVSDDALFGGDLSKWPESFTEYVMAKYAADILPKLSGDKSEQLRNLYGPPGRPEVGILQMRLHAAKNAAAQGQPTQWPAQGAWTSARRGNRAGGNDRGNRGSLIG